LEQAFARKGLKIALEIGPFALSYMRTWSILEAARKSVFTIVPGQLQASMVLSQGSGRQAENVFGTTRRNLTDSVGSKDCSSGLKEVFLLAITCNLFIILFSFARVGHVLQGFYDWISSMGEQE
jgi:hypothetical protein